MMIMMMIMMMIPYAANAEGIAEGISAACTYSGNDNDNAAVATPTTEVRPLFCSFVTSSFMNGIGLKILSSLLDFIEI